MQGRLLLNVIISKSTTIFQLFARKDQPLLVGRNTFLILDLSLNIINSIRALNLKSDCFSSQSLNKSASLPLDEEQGAR